MSEKREGLEGGRKINDNDNEYCSYNNNNNNINKMKKRVFLPETKKFLFSCFVVFVDSRNQFFQPSRRKKKKKKN